MQISEINNDKILLNNRGTTAAHVADRISNHSSNRKKAHVVDDNGRKKIGNASLKFNKIDSLKVDLNEVAGKARETDKKTTQVASYIERMKVDLEQITKSFPPFLPGSEDRVKRLRSFQSFRRLIDQLTIPPKRDFDRTGITSAQKSVSEVPAGEALEVPELGDDATDMEIQVASEQLERAKEGLSEAHAAIEAETAHMIKHFEKQKHEVLEINVDDAEAPAE